MKISLAQALKEKSRLAGEITHLWQLFQNENSCLETHKRKIDVKQTLQTIDRYTAKLVELKTKISVANQGTHLRNMEQLAELKKQLNALSLVQGSEDPEFDCKAQWIKRTAVFNEAALESMRKKLLRKIDLLQDQLDAHNAKTEIDFETPLK